jgi:hypothetical protein
MIDVGERRETGDGRPKTEVWVPCGVKNPRNGLSVIGNPDRDSIPKGYLPRVKPGGFKIGMSVS